MPAINKTIQGAYRLEVPLDASGIKDFKPDRALKVVAYDSRGGVQERIVKFEKNGSALASFSFEALPGRLQIIVGPENATAEQLKGLQTISVDILARQWLGKRELKLKPILISPYYWKWWWWWCRDFKITGKVVCANGNPVPGATVCAYDVDWWWWWWSKNLVGCATTDASGSFEIDFTRCCGWWPWWWWKHQVWLLNPMLVDRILPILQQDPTFGKLPLPSPKPGLEVFQQLLDSRAAGAPPSRSELSLISGQAKAAKFDPASLDGLRSRLLQVLPRIPEFERLRLWPWWPWWPWWDCDADIIFHVTQNCQGKDNVIVDETLFDVHWNIPTDFSITLTANDQACCLPICDGNCPTGDCLLPTDICYFDNVGSIGGNEGAIAAAPVGLLNPGLGLQPGSVNGRISYYADRPYAGSVPIYGAFGDLVDADYYELLVYSAGNATPTTPLPAIPSPIPYNPMPVPAFAGFSRLHLVFIPSPHWPSVPFPVQPISDGVVNHYVIETISHYEANNGLQLWDSSTFNLLAYVNTLNNLANGTYFVQVQSWKRPGYSGNLTNPTILPICGTESDSPPTDNYWVFTIDNQVVTSGPADPNGIPCAGKSVHLCTGQPEAAILQVQILHNDGTVTSVGPCDNVCIVSTDQLQVDFVAYDPDAYLAYYTLQVLYSSSLYVDLLSLGGTLTASPIAPFWAPGATQFGPDYGTALADGATSPWWSGGAMRLTVNAALAFPETCAYTMQLFSHKRTVDNCDHSLWNQYNVADSSFTIVNPCPPSEVAIGLQTAAVQRRA